MSGYRVEYMGLNFAVVQAVDEGFNKPGNTEIVPITTYIDCHGEVLYDQSTEMVDQFNVQFAKWQVCGVVIGPTRQGHFLNIPPFTRALEG